MFLPNDVILYLDPPDYAIRILWIEPQQALAYTYQLRRRAAVPQPIPLHTLRADVLARRARLLLGEALTALPVAAPSAKHRALQLRAWHAVLDAHQDLPALYAARTRPAILAACSARHGISAVSLMRYLRRYWERGQTIEALLPDYANSGARGKQRGVSVGVKRGRPRKGMDTGPNADAALRAVFQAAATQYAATHGRLSRPAAYRQMLADHFAGSAPEVIPSYGQFNYWLTRDGC